MIGFIQLQAPAISRKGKVREPVKSQNLSSWIMLTDCTSKSELFSEYLKVLKLVDFNICFLLRLYFFLSYFILGHRNEPIINGSNVLKQNETRQVLGFYRFPDFAFSRYGWSLKLNEPYHWSI